MTGTRFTRKGAVVAAALLLVILAAGGYFGLERFLEWYLTRSARDLVAQEQRGELSREYGYAWAEINLARKMRQVNRGMTAPAVSDDTLAIDHPAPQPGRINRRYPSLAAIRELNSLERVSNFILITDRHDFPLAEIRTTHTRLTLDDFNPVLLQAVLSAEDTRFHTRPLAWEYRGFVRAVLRSFLRSVKTLSLPRPRGTSTIHQQVARFLLSRFDARGYAVIERSLARKIRELKLAQALKFYYPDEKEVLQVYLNHCVSAGYAMTGYGDISQGLFGKKPSELDICQSLYLARLVKWNRNIPDKIMAQVRVDMPRMAASLGWDPRTQDSILAALPGLRFLKPLRIVSEHNPLVDLANEFWLKLCRANGMPEDQVAEMDFSQPHTLIRRKGNLKIRLTVDLRLQKKLETLVRDRGYGRDTTLLTDVRIGSFGETLSRKKPPRDTLRSLKILKMDSSFSEPGSQFKVTLRAGESLIRNIRYKSLGEKQWRRSVFLYRRDSLRVAGQYYAYALMDSRSGELLAYYSRDNIGSRLSALLRNRTPNGSSVAKPILYALNYDLGRVPATAMLTDSVEVPKPAAWARRFLVEKGKRTGMVYLNTSAPGGYPVRNHGNIFEGYDYLFNHLTESNNILCVEMIYRLNNDSLTGTQIYARIAGLTGAKTDSIDTRQGRIPLPPDYYSVALGTLELSLYQSLHLFNVLYRNEIIENPETHPALVLKDVLVSSERVEIRDSIPRRPVFTDPERIRPVILGLHKRLVSNPADGLAAYDVLLDSASGGALANFAKSGTSDDIIRPYNRDIVTRERTNYCLWNAVLRLTLPAADYEPFRQAFPEARALYGLPDSVPETETRDVTLSCVGEGNQKNTGVRDGKTLHKFLSAGLLRAWGTPVDSGFFRGYEQYLISQTPDSARFADPYEPPALDPDLLEDIREEALESPGSRDLAVEKRLLFGWRLVPESHDRLLSFTLYFGSQAARYHELLEQLDDAGKPADMAPVVEEMRRLKPGNAVFRAEYERALSGLARSIAQAGQ